MNTRDNGPTAYGSAFRKHASLGALIVLLASHAAWADSTDGAPESSFSSCGLIEASDGSGQNQEQALACFRKGADRGEQQAQMVLGLAYWLGNGVPQDRVEGYKWLLISVSRDAETVNMFTEYEWQLTPEQAAQATAAARKWTEAHPTQPR